MAYHEQIGTRQGRGRTSGLRLTLLGVVATAFLVAVFGNGGGFQPDTAWDQLQASAKAPAAIADWRGNSAHIPAAE
jgi:hypothetical protein